MAAPFSEALLRDFRVLSAAVAIVGIGAGEIASFTPRRRVVVHLVIEGSTTIRLSRSEPATTLRAGDSVLLFYGDGHMIGDGCGRPQEIALAEEEEIAEEPRRIDVGDGPAEAVVLSAALELAYISPTANAIRAAPKMWVLHADGTPPNRALGTDLGQLREVLRGGGGTAFAVVTANLHLVHAMRTMTREMWSDRPVDVRSPATRRLAAAVVAIHAHPEHGWSVASLAQEVGLSRSGFAAAFTEAFGTAPMAYVTRLRMARAAHLIEAESMPLAEVARRSGYPVQSSFARAFVAHHGLSPKQFLAKQRQARRVAQER